MDRSPLMYEIDDQTFFKDKLSQRIAVGETSPTLEELDPSLELAVDLQGLINSNVNNSSQDIFTGLLQVPDSRHTDFGDINVAVLNSQPPSVDSQDDSSNQSVQMPHLVQYYDQNNYLEVKRESSLQEVSTLDLTSLLGGSNFPYEGVTVAEATSTEAHRLPEADSPQQYSAERTTLKATPPSKSRRKNVLKGSEEYKEKRERNNVAVRKSRDKAKVRQQETEVKVKSLTDENQKLQKKVDLLSKELTVLKGLFTNVGATLPEELRKQFEQLSRK